MDTAPVDTAPAPWSVPPGACPSRTVVEVLANKWVLYVLGELGALGDGSAPRRFNELQRSIPGITQKMLTQTLRTLERDGLVERTVYPTVPPRVEYAPTPLGREAGQLAAVIGHWARSHVHQITTAREKFDEKAKQAVAPLT
ncbi:helix-turn-helix domain-containing protein [Streptomyces luteosporeus]|uniref:Helix-turn-helix domain-containing protein n=1 Tax=Streptomyces luteosporeus TaxID=173856 RepID=A0ABP6G4U6_9ACTN